MLNALNVYKEARDLGSTKTYSEIQLMINNANYAELCEIERQRYQASLWDKESSINGVSATTLMEGVPPGGSVYLIQIDGNLVYLQKHDPSQMGFVAMDDVTALSKAAIVIESLVQSEVDSKIKNDVLIASLM